MPQAAHAGSIEFSTNDSDYYEIDGAKSVRFKRGVDIFDVTDLKDTSAAHIRATGLFDSDFSISGEFEQADTNGQVSMLTVFAAGSTGYLRYKPNGSAGWKVAILIQDVEISSEATSLVAATFTCVGNGAVSAV